MYYHHSHFTDEKTEVSGAGRKKVAGTQLGRLRILHNQSLSYDLLWIRVARECWYKHQRTENLCDTRLSEPL